MRIRNWRKNILRAEVVEYYALISCSFLNIFQPISLSFFSVKKSFKILLLTKLKWINYFSCKVQILLRKRLLYWILIIYYMTVKWMKKFKSYSLFIHRVSLINRVLDIKAQKNVIINWCTSLKREISYPLPLPGILTVSVNFTCERWSNGVCIYVFIICLTDSQCPWQADLTEDDGRALIKRIPRQGASPITCHRLCQRFIEYIF